MSNSKSKSADPSIDEMLASIREAIQEETARETEQRDRLAEQAGRQPQLAPPETARTREGPVSGTMRELRVSLQPSQQTSGGGSLTARSEDFLSYKNKIASLRASTGDQPGASSAQDAGDKRLEDAITRMNAADARQQAVRAEQVTSAEPRAAMPTMPPRAEMRSSVHEPAPQDVRNVIPPQPAEPVMSAPPAAAAPQPEQPDIDQPPQAISQPPQLPLQAAQSANGPMLSDETSAMASAAFDRLTEELFKRVDGGKTVLDDGVRDILRPMLKKWLDDNLPSLVERLVREEIERVARRGGR